MVCQDECPQRALAGHRPEFNVHQKLWLHLGADARDDALETVAAYERRGRPQETLRAVLFTAQGHVLIIAL